MEYMEARMQDRYDALSEGCMYSSDNSLVGWQCIVAIDEGGTGWIIARSDKIRDTDLLLECSTEDNGFNRGWDSGLSVGVYRVTLKPWGYQGHEGEWDTGVDVVKAEPLWTIPEMNYRLVTP